MIPNIGPMEIGIVLVIALVVFGPKRLPELGKSLGSGIRGFGKSLKGEDDEEAKPALDPAEGSKPEPVAQSVTGSNGGREA
jgi:sec-independent protein translocase protein TatA